MKGYLPFENGVLGKYSNEVIFHVLLVVYALVILADSRNLQPDAALVPRMMAVGLIVTALARILLIVAPDYVPDQLMDIGFDPAEMATMKKSRPSAREVLEIIGWLIAYVVAIYLFGIVYATFIFVLSFTYVWGNRGAIVSVIFSLLTSAFVVYVFGEFLRINLKRGILPLPVFW